MLNGINILADTVKVTMGPKGRNVVIEKEHGPPVLTKDGVTVAKAINVKEKFVNLGIQMIKEVWGLLWGVAMIAAMCAMYLAVVTGTMWLIIEVDAWMKEW